MALQTAGLGIFGTALLAASAASSEQGLLLCLCLGGAGRGLWDCNNMPVFCDVTSFDAWSTTYGVFNFANVISGGLAVFVAGVLRPSLGLGGMLAFFCVMLLAASGLSCLSLRRFYLNEARRP